MSMNRRDFMKNAGALGLGIRLSSPVSALADSSSQRQFHTCLDIEALERDPELLSIVKNAGVNTIWTGGFFYGHWPHPIEKLQAMSKTITAAGLGVNLVNVPLGHPGDSLGAKDGNFPLTPPRHWKTAQRADGSIFVGTSLHDPATEENAAALQKLSRAGFNRIFLDDDFRLAPGPGQIGGCFCPEHRDRFLRRTGYTPSQWEELLEQVRSRRFTRLLRDWLDFSCDELTGSFRKQQSALGTGELGIMVMYLGAEKAGIRLTDYPDTLFRVGELMFDDASFNPIKGKTDELFSVLMHRRFVKPEWAFSETTAFPADKLSARNMAAKLAITTIADVRNTMFMSGITPFPRTHWETLGPAMKMQANQHKKLLGHKPSGPFKHYWGEYSRKIGSDQPFSLFLATGVPFAVTDEPAREGWTFLSDADAQAVADSQLKSPGTVWIRRATAAAAFNGGEAVMESLDDLWALKQRLIPQFKDTPYVEENKPVVCAWYPSARSVLLWNLSEDTQLLTLKIGKQRRQATVKGLETALIEEV